MNISQKTFTSLGQIQDHIKGGLPTLYHGSRTSTVIPFDKILSEQWGSSCLGDLSQLPKKCHLDERNNLVIEGPVTWAEGKALCRAHGRDIMTAPTEELACILSGVSTSCTGERSFGLGTLREQVIELEFIDHRGEIKKLTKCDLNDSSDWPLPKHELRMYQAAYKKYQEFKNAPFPRFQKEIDLLIGTEGQLGIITKGIIKTMPLQNVTYLFFSLPKWENEFIPHLELYELVQRLRGKVLSCELLDENSWCYLKEEDIPAKGRDIIFFEIISSEFNSVYEGALSRLKNIDQNDIFEVSENRIQRLRRAIPRGIFEYNSKAGVIKKGTDIQMMGDDFEELLLKYREMAQIGIRYNLFGHFGDGHLHFNFMPRSEDEQNRCQEELEQLYLWVRDRGGSPFAEHGIGLLKQDFIQPFYGTIQKELFAVIKRMMDPQGVFFPFGFLGGHNGV